MKYLAAGGDPRRSYDWLPIHDSVTIDRVAEAVTTEMYRLDNPGFCLACGDDADGCEPDARHYQCVSCGARAVFGAQEVLFMLDRSA